MCMDWNGNILGLLLSSHKITTLLAVSLFHYPWKTFRWRFVRSMEGKEGCFRTMAAAFADDVHLRVRVWCAQTQNAKACLRGFLWTRKTCLIGSMGIRGMGCVWTGFHRTDDCMD
uniref:RNA-directed DNA polymerase (Reverse transcriptase) n=1 Tax=Panagrellus redivivus TaxID=6233 RepID=A0A7E4ZYN1_PANRE